MCCVGDKTFLCDAEVCTDTLFVPDQMASQEIVFMSEGYWQLVEEHPEFSAYFAVSEATYFVAPDGTAYHFRLGADTEVVQRPASPTPTRQIDTPTPAPTVTTNGKTEDEVAPRSAFYRLSSAIALGAVAVVVIIRSRRR